MFSPDEYDGAGDLPDRLAFVKPDRARLWIDLHDRDDVPTAATLADGHDVSTATVYRMLEELAKLGLAENVSTYRDGRATTGFRALEPGADTSREILADGGPVFEGGRATTCLDCGGDLQYQNRQSILCLGCGQDYEHWKNASSHHLVEVDARTGESEIVESTPRNVETDGGQSSNGTERYGPFHYTGSEGFEAWGYRFPSEFIILEWIPESVPEGDDKIHGGHQSVYHSFDEFRTICTGEIEWGRSPHTDTNHPEVDR